MSTVSQSARVLAVLKDGKPHSVPEIHKIAGTMRLNSRVADLRKRGHVIVCERVKGLKGAAAYHYTWLGERESLVQVLILEKTEADRLRESGQLQLDTDTIAPRTEGERYRIFRVKDGGEPEIVATSSTEEGIGIAICRLGAEGEFLDYCVGVMDALDHKDEKDEWVGKWLVLPWQAKMSEPPDA